MDDLNRRVAEALGWKIAKDESGSYIVEDADGKAVFLRSRDYIYHQSDAWNNSVEHWATTPRHAISLMADKNWSLHYYEIAPVDKKKVWQYEITVWRGDVPYIATDEFFPVAICEAFLLWSAATQSD